jgi:hypothetical protein
MDDFKLFEKLKSLDLEEGSWSRKHFVAIADMLKRGMKQSKDKDLFRDLAKEFASFLATQNPNFNRSKFLDACGVDENEFSNPDDEALAPGGELEAGI